MKMVKGIFAITRGHELVEMKEVEYPSYMRPHLEMIEGEKIQLSGKMEGCECELVGIE